MARVGESDREGGGSDDDRESREERTACFLSAMSSSGSKY